VKLCVWHQGSVARGRDRGTLVPRLRAFVPTSPGTEREDSLANDVEATMVTRTPGPGSEEERAAFALLQQSFAPMHRRLFADEALPRTVVVVPSLSLSVEELAKLEGVLHYEERMLCLLLLLRMPHTRVIHVTSMPVAPEIVSYHLDMLPDPEDAARRLTMVHVGDPSLRPLSAKLVDRPDLLTRIRTAIHDPASAHLTCFAASPLERTLAVSLGIPLYAADPDLWYLGTKSEGRRVFRQACVEVPAGTEDVRSFDDVIEGLARLRGVSDRAVIKLDEGFSGEGNAVIDLRGTATGSDDGTLKISLPSSVEFEAPTENWPSYSRKLAAMGGIVEAFVDGDEVRSPSVQCRVEPSGAITVISTHDQVLGGKNNQVYLGCHFPADEAYRRSITQAAVRVSDVLARRGVIGRFGIDFLTVRSGDTWKVYGLEINLRKGGTTLPYLMLDYLTRGRYDPAFGEYKLTDGLVRAYHASDNVRNPAYVGMDVVDARHALGDLAFDRGDRRGVVMHLLGALPAFGKLGITAIAETRETATRLFEDAVVRLDAYAGTRSEVVSA